MNRYVHSQSCRERGARQWHMHDLSMGAGLTPAFDFVFVRTSRKLAFQPTSGSIGDSQAMVMQLMIIVARMRLSKLLFSTRRMAGRRGQSPTRMQPSDVLR